MKHDPRLVAAVLRSDFYSFVRASFPIVSAGETFVPNWHLEAMAYGLTRVMRGEILRLAANVPPRSLKSILASVALPAFVLGQDPTKRIICVSYSESLARKHANDTRNLMRSKLYTRLFPNTRISPSKDTEAEFTTTLGGGRLATSVGGTLTGRGGNFVIIDDAMKPQDAYSQAARESVQQWYGNTLLSRLNDKTRDAIVLLMQRLHVDDLVGHVLQDEGWTHLNLPAIADCDSTVPLSANRFHQRKVGDVLHPEREPREVLDELRLQMGSLDFSAQYLQQPVPEGGNLVKWDWFGTYDRTPAVKGGDIIIVSWDTALTAKELASYSVCVVLLVRDETVFVLDVIRKRLEYPDLKRAVIRTHLQWRNTTSNYALLIENKGSGMSLIQDLKRDGHRAIAIEPEGDKIMRMQAQTARLEAGSVILPRHASWLGDFRAELLAFPAGRFSDQVDAFSQALKRAFNPPPRYRAYAILGCH